MEHERIILIRELLSRRSNDKNGVTIKDIQKYLSENTDMEDVSAITIRRDIERLIRLGDNIKVENKAHNTAYYKLVSDGFNFNEIRFIVDSVSINKFLSDSQKQKLIKKFKVMCSDSEVRQLISRISLNSTSKYSSYLLENLDKVHTIISQKRKINFEYGKFDINKNIVYYPKDRDVYPCKVVYFNDRFYLKCMDISSNTPRTYRIDRMRKITAGDKVKSKPSLPVYDGAVVDIFDPDRFEIVTLRINRVLLDDMLEQFGKYAGRTSEDREPSYAIVNVKVGISKGFYKWVLKYGNDMEIIGPENIRNEFKKLICDVSSMYE